MPLEPFREKFIAERTVCSDAVIARIKYSRKLGEKKRRKRQI